MRNSQNWVCISLCAYIYSCIYIFIHPLSLENLFNSTFCVCFCFAVHHLDYLGVQVAWVTGPWFLSIFMNMLPWESGQVLFVSYYHIFKTFITYYLIKW